MVLAGIGTAKYRAPREYIVPLKLLVEATLLARWQANEIATHH